MDSSFSYFSAIGTKYNASITGKITSRINYGEKVCNIDYCNLNAIVFDFD